MDNDFHPEDIAEVGRVLGTYGIVKLLRLVVVVVKKDSQIDCRLTPILDKAISSLTEILGE